MAVLALLAAVALGANDTLAASRGAIFRQR
jgi:hypothetical protein